MIYPSLTDEQMKRSQRLFIAYNIFNGISFMCVGGQIVTLLGNRLNFPDRTFTIFAALFNIGCIWLPLGKIATEKWGAARTQANFWFLRNFAAIIMGSCAIWGLLGYPVLAEWILLIGAFIFYGCRAAGGVMSTALVGNITHPDERGKLLAFSSMSHNFITAFATIAMFFILRHVEAMGNNPAIIALFLIIIFGSACGMLSAACLRSIDESDAIKEAAKKPLIADAWACLKDSAFRRMAIGHVCFSLAMAFTFSVTLLVLKRGYNMSDSMILIYTFASSFMNVAFARPASKLGDKIGPRKALIVGYCFNFLLIFFWLLAPDTFSWTAVIILMALSSMCSMCCGICFGQYYLKCIPVEHQPSASTLNSLINGVLTGFIAMFLTTLLWKGCDYFLGTEVVGMIRYRFFFKLSLPFVALGFIGVWMQKEV